MMIDFAGEANDTESRLAQDLEHYVIGLEWFPTGTGVVEKGDVYIGESHADHWIVRDVNEDGEQQGNPYKVLFQLVHRAFVY